MRIGLVFLAAVLLFSFTACGDDDGTPAVTVFVEGTVVADNAVTDFGSIGASTTDSRQVILSNSGTGTLTIEGLYSTQSNTAFSVSSVGFRNSLACGETTGFNVIFDSTGQPAGHYGIGVFFNCNDATNASWTLVFTGDIL